jgi:predicted metallopeptidase
MKQMTFGKKTYTQVDKDAAVYTMINDVIQDKGIMTGGANITVVFVRPCVTPTTVARIIRSGKELKFLSDFDYLIEISQDVWDRLTDEVRKIVMWHELRHIKVTEAEDGTYVFKLVNHNVQDFEEILALHGIKWFSTLKGEILDLYANDAKIKPKDDPEVQKEKTDKLAKKRQDMGDRIRL